MTPTLYIQLGRLGDILNILPMLWKDAQGAPRPKLMVAAEYAPLLEGVSYVEPVIYPGPHFEIAKAVEQAKRTHPGHRIVCLQVNGPKEETLEHTYKPAGLEHAATTSFSKESWRVAGRLAEWGKYPLVFDRRDTRREAELSNSIPHKTSRPLVLLATEGNSSPFPHAELLQTLVRRSFPEWRVLDLPKAGRVFDLLAVYEKARCLVAIDSAPLHLARAVPELPVFALTNDRPMAWNGSAWSPNWAWSCRYSDFPKRAVEMLEAIENFGAKPSRPFVEVWNAYDNPPRKSFPNRTLLPVLPGACGRDSALALKDPLRIPFLKDCLRMALLRAKDGEHICLRRPETTLLNRSEELLSHEACFAFRIQGEGADSLVAAATDLFCAKKAFWLAHFDEVPDLVMGTDYYWSHALWTIFKKYGAQDVTGICYRSAPAAKAVPAGKAEPPRMEHNRKLCAEAVSKLGALPRYNPVVGLPLDTSALPRFAYNPSIARAWGKVWLTYRYHFADDLRTKLGLAEIVGNKALDPRDLSMDGISVEDARLVPFHGELLLSWVDSDFVGQATPKAIIKYAEMTRAFVADDKPADLKLGRVYQPGPHCNTGTHMQKNWAFFESDENLFAIYQSQPENIVFQIQGDAVINEYRTPAPTWAYGAVRGGNVVPYNDTHLLRFFHSRTDFGLGKIEPRYYVGACLMERRPPFTVTRVSSKPILYGSELPKADCFHFKPGVVFPCGAIPHGDGWMLSVGINDSSCALVKVTPKGLNL